MHGVRGISEYRSVWVSDTHLGTRGCKADVLLDFLEHTSCKKLYLVGDIVDGWRLQRSWYWAPSHNAVLGALLKKVKQGTKVIYVPGNHDECLRDYCGLSVAGVELAREYIHEAHDGRKLLVTHGDDFDVVVRYARWIAILGDWAYTLLLAMNHYFNVMRKRLGMPYWSLSAWLKDKVKNAVEYVSSFEVALAEEAKRRQLDGVVCGHIHRAEIREIDGILYMNDGDWVESCTALVEHRDGRFEIVQWSDAAHRSLECAAVA